MTKTGIIIVAGAMVLAALALVVAGREPLEFSHPEVGVQVAHAQQGDPGKGCSKCHTAPIVATCVTCHPAPRTRVANNIAFPHHDPAASGPAIKDCSFALCHGGAGGDARFVKVTRGVHTYCRQCHQVTHG